MRDSRRRIALVISVVCLLAAHSPSQPTAQPGAFTGANATELLGQVARGLTAHNPDRMLRAFDLTKMADGALFRQQITSFFAETDSIRVHFDQVRTATEDGRGVITVQVEMEAEHRDDRVPALHKQAELRLLAEPVAGRWKLTEIQPRAFFSPQP